MFHPRSMLVVGAVFCVTVLGDWFTASAVAQTPPKQPQLGLQGNLVSLKGRGIPAPDDVPNVGIRVESVKRGTPAAAMGLEPGDIIVSIDSMRFTTLDGYRYALRAAGQRPSILLLDVRTKKVIRRTCHVPHQQAPESEREPRPPETYLMMIDLVEDMRDR